MEPNFQGLVQGQTRPRSRLMARPGFYGHKKTGLLCCFAERLQVGILSIVAGIKLIDLYFPMCVDCSTRAGRCAGKILIPV